MANEPYSIEELRRLITTAGESSNVDAKAPVEWDEGVNSASLAKDIAAFANSRDGGAIVIGKSPKNDGGFEHVGLTAEQASTFDTTRVANWVNSRFQPPIYLASHVVEDEGKRFVVIVVSEFSDIPILCMKPFDLDRQRLLKDRTIYVRTANAASAPLGTPDELRELVGLATRKRGDEMLATIRAMLAGKPLISPPDDRDLFEKQLATVLAFVEEPVAGKLEHGAWRMLFHPSSFRAERFHDASQLEYIIASKAVKLRDEFPANQRGTTALNWGIGNSYYGERWGFSREGLFVWCEEFEEKYDYKSYWRSANPDHPYPEVPAGQWVNYLPQLFKIIEFFTFMARMAPIYDSSESLLYRLRAGPIKGRRLLSTDPAINIDARFAEPAVETFFVLEGETPIPEFQATWKDECAAAAKRYFELFPGHQIGQEAMRARVERFLVRDF